MPTSDLAPLSRLFWDRAARLLLRHPAHLRAIVRLLSPELAAGLAFERMETIGRSFVHEDYRQREADFVARLPLRHDRRTKLAYVYVLLEHQATVDATIPRRMLCYLNDLLNATVPRRQARLPLVVGIVFHTGRMRWRAPRDFREMVDAPRDWLEFAPSFRIIYVSLPETGAGDLEAQGAFGRVLRAIQALDADSAEFRTVVERAAVSLRAVKGRRWEDLVRFLSALATYYRPREEAEQLRRTLSKAADTRSRRAKVTSMVRSAAVEWFEEGQEKGREEGREEGREALRETVLRLGERRWGRPRPIHRRRLMSIHDAKRLEALAGRILDATSWENLLDGRGRRHQSARVR